MSTRLRRVLLVVVCCVGSTQLPLAQDSTWHEDLLSGEVNALVAAGGLRIVDLRVDAGSGRPLFDVAVVPDTTGQPWSWSYDLTPARAQALLQSSARRPVALAPYLLGSDDVRLAVLWAPGMPGDTAAGWLVVANQTRDSVAELLAGGGLVAEQVAGYATAAGERLVVVARGGGSSAAARASAASVALDLEDITSRVAALLAVTDGTQGLYLKQVGGLVLAGQNANFAFEPASTIKAAAGYHAFEQVEVGSWSLGDLVNVYQPPASGSCPTNTDVGDETLATAMREMLWHSDNSRTRVIVDAFGQATINATMSGIGMASSSINHVIGCGGPPENQLTLVDAGVLYEDTADGTLIAPASVDLFHSFFAGKGQFMVEGYDWTGLWDTDIPTILLQEAPAGMTASQRQAYRNQMDLAYKAGNYKICQNASCSDYRDHISIAGWAEVPFCDGTTVELRQFVFGLFIYNSTSDATSAQAFGSAKGELLREQIRDGLASCFHADLSLLSSAAPNPVLSGHDFAVGLDAGNAGPMEAAAISISGQTPPGTTFAGAMAAGGWATSAPAAGGTGPVTFSRPVFAIGASPHFAVTFAVNCEVPDGTAIATSWGIESATTPDLNPGNNTSQAQVVVSNPAPIIGPASASPASLWPPNHRMVNVTVDYTVADNCGTPVCALLASSNEPDNGAGDGDTAGDIEIVDDHHLRLRAERSGGGSGRRYTIGVSCQDSGGGFSSTETAVIVPHDFRS